MRKVYLLTGLIISAFLISTCGGAKKSSKTKQDNSPVLVTIEDEEISRNQFKRVYEKSNKGKPNLYTYQSLKDYLDLYINFRLKVKEAKALQLDTLPSIQQELEKYRDQLAESYLTDKEVMEKLVEEAVDRMQKEVRVQHILKKVRRNASPKDTLKAYNRIQEIKKQIQEGASFAEMAEQHSDDPSAKFNSGDIGYFSALQVVYPFETVAYNTPAGEMAGPVRTRFGYHLIKVLDKRPAQGKVLTAHILIRKPKDASEEEKKKLEEKTTEIYNKIKEGKDFEQMARKHSDDKTTAKKGGKFRWFGAGEALVAYDTTAFSLEENGQVAPPVETQRGWFIIKRLDKKSPPAPEEIKDKLKAKIKKSDRANIAKRSLVNQIKEDYGFEEYPDNKKTMLEKIEKGMGQRSFAADKYSDMDKPLFELGDEQYTQFDLAQYIGNHPRNHRGKSKTQVFNTYYSDYIRYACLEYEKKHLDEKYPEFRSLINEYFDGILLFEITDRKVWSKAVEDTTGLEKYFEDHKKQYTWDKRVDATIYKCASEEVAGEVRKLLAQRDIKSAEEIQKKINAGKKGALQIEKGKFEKGQNPYIDKVEWKKGLSSDINTDEGKVVFVEINALLEPRIKKLEEVRGQVIADYQEHLERKWIRSLKKKYEVNIDKEVLQSLIKQ